MTKVEAQFASHVDGCHAREHVPDGTTTISDTIPEITDIPQIVTINV
jgi:hypothetical protein